MRYEIGSFDAGKPLPPVLPSRVWVARICLNRWEMLDLPAQALARAATGLKRETPIRVRDECRFYRADERPELGGRQWLIFTNDPHPPGGFVSMPELDAGTPVTPTDETG